MSSNANATWTDGKKFLAGSWSYYWAGDYFNVRAGKRMPFRVYGDHPTFGNFLEIDPNEKCDVCVKNKATVLAKNKYKQRRWSCDNCVDKHNFKVIATRKKLQEQWEEGK